MNQKFKGAIFLLIAAFIYGLYGIFSRFIGGAFGSFSQSLIRSLIFLSFILLLFTIGSFKWRKIDKGDIKWFLLWIIPASFQPAITFLAFNHLPVATTYFLIYSTMILGGTLSGKIFYSEKINLVKGLSLLSVLGGLLLIYGSDISLIANIYVLMALLSGLLVGFWNTLTKKVSTKYSELQMMSLDQGATFLVSLGGSVVLHEKLPAFSNSFPWFWILVFTFSSMLTMFLLIKGFKYVEAQIGSLILPLEVVFASIFGFLIFREILSINTYLGGLLIVLAAFLPAIKFSKN